MKSLFKAALAFAILTPLSALANERIVAGDDTLYSNLCATAVSAPVEFERQLRDLRITRSALRCNGMDVREFVSAVRQDNAIALRPGSDNFETAICVAAATSAERFESLKAQTSARLLDAISCNEMPLAEFAREYGNADVRI